MKKLVFIINDLETVGKSTVAVAMRGYLRAQSIDCALTGVVGEEQSQNQLEIYDRIWNLIEEAETAPLIEMLDRHDVVICDVESGLSTALIELFQSADLDLVLGELDVELTVVTPEVESADCHDEIVSVAEAFSDAADYIVARIPREEGSGNMEAWEDSEAIRVMDYMGAVVLELPELSSAFLEVLEAHELSLPMALEGSGCTLPRYISQPLSEWNRAFQHEVSEADDYLYPKAKRGIRRMNEVPAAA